MVNDWILISRQKQVTFSVLSDSTPKDLAYFSTWPQTSIWQLISPFTLAPNSSFSQAFPYLFSPARVSCCPHWLSRIPSPDPILQVLCHFWLIPTIHRCQLIHQALCLKPTILLEAYIYVLISLNQKKKI